MVLPDHEISRRDMIRPFAEGGRRPGIISYGLTSYGYDIRTGEDFYIFNNARHGVVDPKRFDSRHVSLATIESQDESRFVVLPPHGFALCESLEVVTVPRDLHVLCVGKSTYARCGLIVNVTPLEPEWSGTITLELSNTTPLPLRVYVNEGIAQLVFLKASDLCRVSYADKRGKYQNQHAVTFARVD